MATPISYFCNSNEMLSAAAVVPLIVVAAWCCNVLSCSFCSFWSEEYSTNLESSVQWEKTAGTSILVLLSGYFRSGGCAVAVMLNY